MPGAEGYGEPIRSRLTTLGPVLKHTLLRRNTSALLCLLSRFSSSLPHWLSRTTEDLCHQFMGRYLSLGPIALLQRGSGSRSLITIDGPRHILKRGLEDL